VPDSSLERWFFYQDAAGLWKWARLDIVGTVLGHSGASFETRDACVEHARQSGYDDARKPDGIKLVQDSPPATGARVAPI